MRQPDPTPPEDSSPRFIVRESGQYEADRDAAFLHRLSQDPDFPGPLSHARDEAASGVFGREVRRFLYYSPTNKRTGTPVRILFTVLPPNPVNPDEPPETAESVIILRRSSFCCACSTARRHCSRMRPPNPDARRSPDRRPRGGQGHRP